MVALEPIVAVGSQLLRAFDGIVPRMISVLGVDWFTPQVNVDQIRRWFGNIKRCPAVGALPRALSPGMPIYVSGDGELGSAMACRNHRSVHPHIGGIRAKVRSDMLQGRALVFDRRLTH